MGTPNLLARPPSQMNELEVLRVIHSEYRTQKIQAKLQLEFSFLLASSHGFYALKKTFVCACVCPCMSKCVLCMYSAHGDQPKRASGSLE